jgi:L-lactate utilization protein LutC
VHFTPPLRPPAAHLHQALCNVSDQGCVSVARRQQGAAVGALLQELLIQVLPQQHLAPNQQQAAKVSMKGAGGAQ